LEACTALLRPEAVELDAQRPEAAAEAEVAELVAQQEAVVAAAVPDAQQGAAVAAEEPVAQQQVVEAVMAEPDVQQEVVAAQDAQRQEEVMAALSGLRQPEPSVESAETAAVRLWYPGRPASAPGQA
jgi:hypothetical protein